VLLLDVTPLSLGIETLGGVATKLIERNTTIPVRKSEIFSTATDNQTSVEVHVLQGEREMAGDNRTLGKFHLVGIPSAPRGVPQIEVSFDIDANGIVNVSAKDLATGKEQAITITSSSGLNQEDVDRMVREAEQHKDEDRKNREKIEARNRLDALVFSTERSLKDNRDKLDSAAASELESAITEAKSVLEDDNADVARMKQAEERLTQASHKLAELLYQQSTEGASQTGPTNGHATGGSTPPKGEDVVDAEYTEVAN
jgi:molecular chaperone DnaK